MRLLESWMSINVFTQGSAQAVTGASDALRMMLMLMLKMMMRRMRMIYWKRWHDDDNEIIWMNVKNLGRGWNASYWWHLTMCLPLVAHKLVSWTVAVHLWWLGIWNTNIIIIKVDKEQWSFFFLSFGHQLTYPVYTYLLDFFPKTSTIFCHFTRWNYC